MFFFDESRFGTHSKIGRAWFKKGSRTRITHKLGFKSFYLYTAASTTGDTFTLIANTVDKTTMQIFLDEFAKTLSSKVIFVMDNAGWHKSLQIPDLEKFWAIMKRWIKQHIGTYQELYSNIIYAFFIVP